MDSNTHNILVRTGQFVIHVVLITVFVVAVSMALVFYSKVEFLESQLDVAHRNSSAYWFTLEQLLHGDKNDVEAARRRHWLIHQSRSRSPGTAVVP